MKTIFNKTLVAAAVLAFAGASHAATLVGTEHSVTAEYLAGTANPSTATDATFHRSAAVVMTINAEYTLNDTITLTSTAEFGAAMPTTLIAAPNVGANRLGMTFSKISGGDVADKSVIYRLTSTDNTGLAASPITTGQTFTIPAANLEFKKDKLSAGASLTFSAKTNTNLDLDTAGGTARTASLVKVVSQFTKTAPSFAKTIDVNGDRRDFVSSIEESTTNHVKVEGVFNIATLTTAGTTFARPVTKVVHTVTADFSWVKDTNTTTAGLQPTAGVFATTGTCTTPVWTYSTSAVTLACDEVAADTAIVIDAAPNKALFAAGAAPVLPAQDLKVTSEVTYSGAVATAKVWDAQAAGSWTLNGANIQIPYMVFGTVGGKAYNQVIVLNNASSVGGDVFVDVFKEDGTQVLSNKKVGTIGANAALNIAPSLKTELATALVPDGKMSVKVVASIPENKASIYAAFVDTVTGERVYINNDSKVQTK